MVWIGIREGRDTVIQQYHVGCSTTATIPSANASADAASVSLLGWSTTIRGHHMQARRSDW